MRFGIVTLAALMALAFAEGAVAGAAGGGRGGGDHAGWIELESWSWGGRPAERGRVKARLHWDRGQRGAGRAVLEGEQCLVFFLDALPRDPAPGRALPDLEGRSAAGKILRLEGVRVLRVGACRHGKRSLELRFRDAATSTQRRKGERS